MNLAQPHSNGTYSNEPLSQDELVSITALVHYVSHKKGNHIDTTYCHLATEFNVTEAKEIKRRDYERAIRFLVDLEDMKAH